MKKNKKSHSVFTANKNLTQSAWFSFKKSAGLISNLKEAKEKVENFICSSWARENAMKFESTKHKLEEVSKQHKASTKTKGQLQTTVDNTESRIPSPKAHDKETKDGKIRWSTKDKWHVTVALIGALVAISLGGINIFANLKGADLPIFIESPWLVIALSLLLPVGSISIELIVSQFDNDRSRRLIKTFIYSGSLA